MEKFTGTVSGTAGLHEIGSEEDSSFWKPVNHVGKLHLFATRGGAKMAEYKWGETLTSVADVVVAFNEDNSWTPYYGVNVYQSALQKVINIEGVHGRRVVKMISTVGREYWAFQNITDEETTMLNTWAAEHLGRDPTGIFGVIGYPGPTISTDEDTAEKTSDSEEEIEEPF